ncbi:MAG: UvrD-helicase domain-containing protein [Desulfovibrionaceae bacterium]|nr:UvrD-helicase domain-containing protein [Desulfovibrionaceae bacterium]
MNTFLADLHIHSRFSRATSSRLTAPHLAAWSCLKGLSVTATGDFTHPAWREELKEALVRDESSGLYRLRRPPDIGREAPGFSLPGGSAGGNAAGAESSGPLFLLEAEISSIYKKDGAVRKIHNLVYMPDFDSVERLCRKLEQIGNLASDGRPILGLDSKRLLEMVLETDERGVVIPAHIWTPWFSLFGSKSGFDSLEACFEDLSPHIFALETGLSSDPDMNRLWSGLDRYVMVSSSDAHSGENLGREATAFSGSPSYDGIFGALRRAAQKLPAEGGCAYEGTVEFFPEEGKYHLDGHRNCHVVLTPEETRRLNGRCPVCGRELTVGVLSRVTELADRSEPVPPAGTGFSSLIPLAELLGELLGVGSKSVKVQRRLAALLQRFGPELDLLKNVPEADIRREWDELGEAVSRMRRGRVIRQGGYDGEYGVVRVFEPGELGRQGLLMQEKTSFKSRVSVPALFEETPPVQDAPKSMGGDAAARPAFTWSRQQEQALQAGPGPVLVLAGPGAGKTRTLVGRIARLLQEGVEASRIAAVTFTRRAAGELRERLAAAFPGAALPQADTLHALALPFWQGSTAAFTQGHEQGLAQDRGLMNLSKRGIAPPLVLDEEGARSAFAHANEACGADRAALRKVFEELSLCREKLAVPSEGVCAMMERYTAWKRARNMADYTDLLENWLACLKNGLARPWEHVLVDEVQDLSPLQLELVRHLLPPSGEGFFGIGDPDQAIYGFRGAHPDVQGALKAFWPDLTLVTLAESYRSGQEILSAADALLGGAAHCGRLRAVRPVPVSLKLFSAPDARREAEWIAAEIGKLLGATSHTLADAAKGSDRLAGTFSPGEIAVLVRIRALMPPLREALFARGIPVSVPETEPFWKDARVSLMLGLAARHFGRPADLPEDAPSVPEAAFAGGPETLFEALVQQGALERLAWDSAAFQQLRRSFAEQRSWEGLLDWVCLRRDLDLARESGEFVRIMTIHAAKGLEFRAVFLPALEDGLLPYAGPGLFAGEASETLPEAEQEEERRLLYVGLTRASEAVYVSRAEKRRIYGKELALPPSRFLRVLPSFFTQVRLVRRASAKTQMSLL